MKGRLARLLVCVCAALALTAGAAQAAPTPRPQLGRLPGFPRLRGVIPVHGTAAGAAHERVVREAFSAARARVQRHTGTPVPNEEFGPECPPEFAFTQNVCYNGGPVLHQPTVHLIFWQGKPGATGEEKVKAFPSGYIATIEHYFRDVAHDSALGLPSNVFAVSAQYGEGEGAGAPPGSQGVSFDESEDVAEDTRSFPTHTSAECADETKFSEGPCLLEGDLETEVSDVAATKSWNTATLGNLFVVFTPPGVGGCAFGSCAYEQYCAFHGDFGGEGVYPPGNQTIYADLPYVGEVPGCDSGVHPNDQQAIGDNGADAVIDDASHEVNEAITDPLGSQCKDAVTGECEPFSWTDYIGQEIDDKCLPPETTEAGIYGEPLGGGSASTLYNQLIDGDHYWTQTVWSNTGGDFQGACVQRVVNAAFSGPAGAQATAPASFDGSASGEGSVDPVDYWIWDFGDGVQVGTPEATVSHTYALAGTYTVTLTAIDIFGNSNTVTHTVTVGAPPAPPLPTTTPTTTTTVTVTTPTPAPIRLSSAALAAKLGLPHNGATLAGLGAIALGHGVCPPACAVTLRLYTSVRTTVHGRHVTKQVLIGSLTHTVIAANGTGALALKLNATGSSLLRRAHRLRVALTAIVEDQQGATWSISRSLTLSSAAHAARRRSR